MFVSRAVEGEIRTRKLYSSSTEPDDAVDYRVYLFHLKRLPMRRPPDNEYAERPRMELVLDMPDGAVYLNFEEDDEMSQAQVLSYLEHDIDWD